MKLSDIHIDRIRALENTLASFDRGAADELTQKAMAFATAIVELAPDGADAGRLTHSIDCVRAALEALAAAEGIGRAKRRRVEEEKPSTQLD